MAQRGKHLPAVEETRVQSLSREDPLEKEMATHSSILAWRIPWMEDFVFIFIFWMEDFGRLQSMGSQRVRNDWATSFHFMWVHSVGSLAEIDDLNFFLFFLMISILRLGRQGQTGRQASLCGLPCWDFKWTRTWVSRTHIGWFLPHSVVQNKSQGAAQIPGIGKEILLLNRRNCKI